MSKTKMDRSSGFGMVGWAFLILVIYAIVSVAIGVSTDDKTCGAGYHREWGYVPPQWVCR
jgi:hypothetical protein